MEDKISGSLEKSQVEEMWMVALQDENHKGGYQNIQSVNQFRIVILHQKHFLLPLLLFTVFCINAAKLEASPQTSRRKVE